MLLLFVYANSLTELMNRELVIVELLQAIVGSVGILLTMPLTALVCAVLYSRKHGDDGADENYRDGDSDDKDDNDEYLKQLSSINNSTNKV